MDIYEWLSKFLRYFKDRQLAVFLHIDNTGRNIVIRLPELYAWEGALMGSEWVRHRDPIEQARYYETESRRAHYGTLSGTFCDPYIDKDCNP